MMATNKKGAEEPRELDEEKDQIYLLIGQRIRNLRKDKGLTLNVLAEKIGFSKSFMSQIENLKRQPSIGTLTKIARALGVDTLYLISGSGLATEESGLVIVRKDERKIMPDAFRLKGQLYQAIAYKKKDRLMDAYIIDLGFDFPKNTKPWHGETFVHVLEGTHEFRYNGKNHIFKTGDSYYFDASKRYMSRSIGRKPSKILVVFTFKMARKPLTEQNMDINNKMSFHGQEHSGD